MGARAGLDRAAVVAAAARLADDEGAEAVSLARLAAVLGVRSPSLYNHVAGQEGLRRELALLGVKELTRRLSAAAVGKSRDAALFAIADAYRAFAKERPGVYATTLRAPDPGDEALQTASGELIAIIFAVLSGYGLSGDDALHATRALRSVAHGFVSLELASGFGLPLDLDESFRRLLRVFAAGLHRPANPGAR
jgi:AcrR family transcriptional regulator